jgi:putative membrane protein
MGQISTGILRLIIIIIGISVTLTTLIPINMILPFPFGLGTTIGIMIIFIIIAFKLVKSNNESGTSPSIILQKRYAKGEITKEEFDKMKEDLN